MANELKDYITENLVVSDNGGGTLLKVTSGINGAFFLKATSDTSNTTTLFRSVTVNNTAQTIKTGSGNLYGWYIINNSASVVPVYVKFYDKVGATSSDTPIRTVFIPTNGTNQESPIIVNRSFGTALSVRCVTGFADNDNTSPANLPIIEVEFL